ncbi:4166_t:CDS:2, partial [Funneliformis mosseae]
MSSQSYFSQNTSIYGPIKSLPIVPGHPVETIRLKKLRSRVEELVGVS